MIRFVFLDLDDTIFDFAKTETVALERTFAQLGLPRDTAFLSSYQTINQAQWARFHRGEISKEQLMCGRFALLFAQYGLSASAEQTQRLYRQNLSRESFLLPGVKDALTYLKSRYPLYLASNGTADTQYPRLRQAGLLDVFSQVFLSDDLKTQKPDPAFFAGCFARIPGVCPQEGVLIGDSLQSDIAGANRAGLRSCWLNHRGQPAQPDIVPDWSISSWAEIRQIL